MAETPISKFRLRPATLNAIDVLATSAGSRSEAVREAVHHWRSAVTEAAGQNVAELAAEDWALLAAACEPVRRPRSALTPARLPTGLRCWPAG